MTPTEQFWRESLKAGKKPGEIRRALMVEKEFGPNAKVPTPKQSEAKRNADIYWLRKNYNRTFQQLADAYGISVSRTRRICLEEERKERKREK